MSFMQEMEDNMNIIEKSEVGGRVYELGYLLVPTIAEEEVPAVYGNLKELVASHEGVMISDDMPRMIPLAYEMLKVVQNVRSKFTNAYFGWLKFEMDADQIGEMKKKLDLDPNVLRFLVIKTVRENTIAAKRFVHREGGAHRKAPGVGVKREEGTVAVEINKEEIDKEIEAMVAA